MLVRRRESVSNFRQKLHTGIALTLWHSGGMALALKVAFLLMTAIHALGHLIPFLVNNQLRSFGEFPYRTAILNGFWDLGKQGMRWLGWVWALLTVAFLLVAVGAVLQSGWWLPALVALCTISMIWSLLQWPETRFGVILNFVVLTLAFLWMRNAGSVVVRDADLEMLWAQPNPSRQKRFSLEPLSPLQTPFFEHAIQNQTVIAHKARIRMHGEFFFNDWYPFTAEEVLTADGQMVWSATFFMAGVPVVGGERFVAGQGGSAWKLLQWLPLHQLTDSNASRSIANRMHADLAAWLPTALLQTKMADFSPSFERKQPVAITSGNNQATYLTVTTRQNQTVKSITFPRWGNPDQTLWREVDFGIMVEEEKLFQGHRVPARIRAGWFWDTKQYEESGEILRAEIDSIEYR
jgi:hypothetical protein